MAISAKRAHPLMDCPLIEATGSGLLIWFCYFRIEIIRVSRVERQNLSHWGGPYR